MNEAFNKKSVRIGTITLLMAIVANFIPALYVSIVYDAMPAVTLLLSLWGVLAATYFFSWVVQPISFYPALGAAGTYMSFVAGSIGDIRIPAIQMAQRASKTEASTPQGDVMAVIGVSASVVVSFVIVTIFTFIGTAVIPHFPKFVTDSFTYLLPALFAAVYTNMMVKAKTTGAIILVCVIGCFALTTLLGIPSGITPLFCVVAGGICSHLIYKKGKKAETKA